MEETRKEVVSILVDNQAGVLTRVVSLYGRRGYNIDSLTVSATNDPTISRITIVFNGNKQTLDQILPQTAKLEVVKDIFLLKPENSVYREILLVKIRADKKARSEIREIVAIYRGKIIHLSRDSMVIELSGAEDKLNAFMRMMSDYNIVESVRTGLIGLSRGADEAEITED